MAKDVITRFKLETTAFDSAIKQASKELSDYSKTATKAKEGFNQFTKSNVDAARALGTMATSSTNAKQKTQELVGAFNEAAKAYNALTKEQQQSDWAKALAGSLTQLQQRIRETKQELQGMGDTAKNIGGVSLFGGGKLDGMLQVFGGNLMTKGFELATSAVTNLVSEVGSCITQGIELARQGEGIRNAFERLGRGDILQGLREATHGTVTDLELMKAAVKFNDFRLPVEELGTMLAFAQQKAKDTGQSVDYMVDSIVTGLGRKSLMILDNLGLSAAEIKEKMGETGDMTKAVGEIIREQMAKAGDYVETAADRAAQASVDLQNAMEELGRKFAPVEEASNQLWTSMKIGILDIIGGPLATLLNDLTKAGRLRNQLNKMNGGGDGQESRTDKALRMLREYSGGGRGVEGKRDLYNRQVASFSQQEQNAWREANRLREQLKGYEKAQREDPTRSSDLKPFISDLTRKVEAAENKANAIQIARSQYEKGGKQYLDSLEVDVNIDTKEATKSLTELHNKLKELKKLRDEAANKGDTKLRNQYNTQIKGVQAKIKAMRGGGTTTTKTEQTEIQKNQKEIDTLTKKYQKLSDAEKTATGDALKGLKAQKVEIQGNIKQLQDRNKELAKMEREAKGEAPVQGSQAQLQEHRTELQNRQSMLAPDTQEWRDLQKEIDATSRQLDILNGKLPKGERATFTIEVDADKVQDITDALEGEKNVKVNVQTTNGVDLPDLSDAEKTVVFKADDQDVMAKALDIQNLKIDPQTLTFTANDTAALQAIGKVQGMTIDEKKMTVVPQTTEAAKQLLKMQTFKLADKPVEVVVKDEKALKDLKSIAKVTIPDKQVKGDQPSPVTRVVNQVQGNVVAPEHPKPVKQVVDQVRGNVVKDERATLTIDVDTEKVQDIADALEGEKNVKVNVQTTGGVDLPDLSDAEKTVVFKADNRDVVAKALDIQNLKIDPQTLTFTANDTAALQAIGKVQGMTIDEKKMTVVPQTTEAAEQLLKMQTFKLADKPVEVVVEDEKALEDLESIAKVTIPDKQVKVNEVENIHPEPVKQVMTITADSQQAKDAIELALKNANVAPKEVKIAALTPEERSEEKNAFTMPNIEGKMAELKQEIQNSEIGTTLFDTLTARMADVNTMKNLLETMIKSGIETAEFADTSQSIWKRILNGENIDDDTWKSMVEKINEKLAEMKLQPITLDFKTGDTSNVKKVKDDAKGIQDAWQKAGASVSQFGSAISQIQDPTAKIIGIIAQGIAGVVQGAGMATSKAGGESPTWYEYLAAAAAITAQMVATISQIHSVTGYSTGGIVGGNSPSGDNIYMGNAMVNSGELILNRAQAGIIAASLAENTERRDIVFEGIVSGDTLRLVEKNNASIWGDNDTLKF